MSIEKVDSDFIFDFFACSPLTQRGEDSLKRLNIYEEVSEKVFFDKLYVNSRFADNKMDEEINIIPDKYEEGVPSLRKKEDIQKAITLKSAFDNRLRNKADYLLEISATPGSGKTTEVHHMIHQAGSSFNNKTFNLVYDLEVIEDSARIGSHEFKIPISHEENGYIHWVFFVHCLDLLCKTAFEEVKNKNQQEKVRKNFKEYFNNDKSRILATEKEEAMFKAITFGTIDSDNSVYFKGLYKAIVAQIDQMNAEDSIDAIFKITLRLLLCIEPDNMNFVVIDNIEQYIRIKGGALIQWYDEDVKKLTQVLSNTVKSTAAFFKKIGLQFSEHFKMISVIRKTSMYASMHDEYIRDQCSIDMSDWFSFAKLYQKRKDNLLPLIDRQYKANTELTEVLNVLDTLIFDEYAFISGNSFMEMLSSMCNGNIRRIGASLSKIAIDIVAILSDSNPKYISISQYKSFWKEDDNRFLMRRAALQYLLRQIVRLSGFADLKLGSPDNAIIGAETVGKLIRRVLVLLSRRSQSVNDDSFVKLHQVVWAVNMNSKKITAPSLNYEANFKPLADVLCALNQPFYQKPLISPWIIIRYNKNVLADSTMLADALKDAWKDFRENGPSCNKYPINEYGVRITKSGHFFVSTIHSDFSFFAALYHNEEAPIMFLKDTTAIKAQIDRVCKKAKEYVNKLNEVDNNFFERDLKARKSSFGVDPVKREHLFLRGPMLEVTLQELIMFRIHMFLVHYQRFLKQHGMEIFGDENAELSSHVEQKIAFFDKEFKALDREGYTVSTHSLFGFEKYNWR
jgi:hypothetical protein